MMRRSKWLIGVATLYTALAGCGIDRGGEPLTEVRPPPDVAQASAIVGPVEDVGVSSVRVNGVDIDTGSALFTIDGAAADAGSIKPGFYASVLVQGTQAPIVATRLSVDFALDAPVESYDETSRQITALGQVVMLDDLTQIDDALAGLDLADRAQVPTVRVSGTADAQGAILATWLGAGTGEVILTGVASNVATAQTAFDVAGQAVDYSMSGVIDVPNGSPSNGVRLRVAGGVAPDAGDPLIATSIEAAPILPAELTSGAGVTLAGFVTQFDSDEQFAVAGVDAFLGVDVEVAGGVRDDLAANRRVVVAGILQADGRLRVDAIEFVD